MFSSTWEVKRFLDPYTYSEEPHGRTTVNLNRVDYSLLAIENALRNVSMVFRSHPEWTVTEPVRNIGKAACSIYMFCSACFLLTVVYVRLF